MYSADVQRFLPKFPDLFTVRCYGDYSFALHLYNTLLRQSAHCTVLPDLHTIRNSARCSSEILNAPRALSASSVVTHMFADDDDDVCQGRFCFSHVGCPRWTRSRRRSLNYDVGQFFLHSSAGSTVVMMMQPSFVVVVVPSPVVKINQVSLSLSRSRGVCCSKVHVPERRNHQWRLGVVCVGVRSVPEGWLESVAFRNTIQYRKVLT